MIGTAVASACGSLPFDFACEPERLLSLAWVTASELSSSRGTRTKLEVHHYHLALPNYYYCILPQWYPQGIPSEVVIVLKPYDKGVFYGVQDVNGVSVVSGVQLYLDLKKYRGCGEEAD